MASFIRTIDRMRFELPLALALGSAAAFATIAAPANALDGLPAGRILAALAFFVVLTPLAWAAMRKPHRAAPVMPALDPVVEAEEEAAPVVRMRRADRHPDAPVPQPIRASRDLGTPFMAVADEPAAPSEEAVADEPEAPIEAADFVVAETPGEEIVPEAIEPEMAEPEITAETPDPDAAEPAEPETVMPTPFARPQRESLAAMMERLSQGVERRAGVPPRRSPAAIARAADQIREAQPGLRDALATLNRLAERR